MTITIEQGVTIEQGIYIGNLPGNRSPRTITPIQNGRVSTAQVKFGTGSFSNGVSNGGLRVTPTTGFGFGTGDFTLEYWYYPTSYADSLGIDMRPASTQGAYPSMGPRATGSTIYYTNSTFRITSSTTATPLNTWNSIALVRYQGNTKMYINGVQEGSTFVDNTNYVQGNCTIGCNGFDGTTGSFPIKGFMDEIRISNIARYTGPYTPATQPFVNDPYTLLLVHCDGTNGSSVFTDSVQPQTP
jgi:hypothetical protein